MTSILWQIKEALKNHWKILLILLLLCWQHSQEIRITKLQNELGLMHNILRYHGEELIRLEKQRELLANELEFKTHPAQIDMSQRAWFEHLIKNSPQVRGIDGKLPRERD